MATYDVPRSDTAQAGGRRAETRSAATATETKHASKTTEFWAFVGLLVALAISGALVDAQGTGEADGFGPDRIWLYISALTVGYMLSRGFAKALRGEVAEGGDRTAAETKQAFKTSEFFAFAAVLVALLVAGNVVGGEGAGTDPLNADRVWLYATMLGIGYLVSRGLAKSGARDQARGNGGSSGAPISDRVKAAAQAFSQK